MRTLSLTPTKTGPKITSSRVVLGILSLWLCIFGSSARAALPNPGFQMKLSGMLTDYDRPYVYGLHPGSGTAADAYLFAINPTTGEVEKFLAVGSNPTDFSINRQEGRLYVANHGFDQTQVVDLDSFTLLPPLRLGTKVFQITAGQAGTVFYKEDESSRDLYKVDTRNGQAVKLGRLDRGQAEFDPSGTFFYHAGSSTSRSQIMCFDVRDGNFVLLNESRERREPIHNFVISPDGSRLFWASHVYDAALNELRALPGDILFPGQIAAIDPSPDADPDGDGASNFLEYARGSHPGDSGRLTSLAPPPPIPPEMVTHGPYNMEFYQHPRPRAEPGEELRIHVEVSADLQHWTPLDLPLETSIDPRFPEWEIMRWRRNGLFHEELPSDSFMRFRIEGPAADSGR